MTRRNALCVLAKHEVRMLELRRERKTEGRKLYGLKTLLTSRIQASPGESQPVRAA